MTLHSKAAWEVFSLFVIPIGGGIPGGVLLAKKYEIAWPFMMVLYFLSDVLLAFVFEPIMLIFISSAKRSRKLTGIMERWKLAIQKTTPKFGHALGPLALIGISFGFDPMTGRAATKASGHGFVTGWALSITGDMFYFTMLMVSTLWLNNVLGDGTRTMIIMLILMFVVPSIIRRIRERRTQ